MNVASRRRLRGVGADHSATGFELQQLVALQARAQSLDLRNEHLAHVEQSAAHRSRFRSRGMEYVESRPYLPGDDIRSIDWRVTARSGRPHTKLYQEERERHVYLIVEFGESMLFGTRRVFKSVAAAEAAALACWAAINDGHRVGALVCNGEQHLEVRARGGRNGALQVLRALVTLGNGGARESVTSTLRLSDTLRRARRVIRPGALVLLLSDFNELDDDTEHELSGLCRRNDLLATLVYDPLEESPPPPGRYTLSDGYDVTVIDTQSADLRAAYTGHFDKRRQRLSVLAARNGMTFASLRTDEDPALAIGRGLSARMPHRARRRVIGGQSLA